MNLFKSTKIFIELCVFSFLRIILPRYKNDLPSLLIINTGFIGDLIISSLLCENEHLLSRFYKIIFVLKDEFSELFSDYRYFVNDKLIKILTMQKPLIENDLKKKN